MAHTDTAHSTLRRSPWRVAYRTLSVVATAIVLILAVRQILAAWTDSRFLWFGVLSALWIFVAGTAGRSVYRWLILRKDLVL